MKTKLNHILVIEDLLSSTQCEEMINSYDPMMFMKDFPPRNYFYYDLLMEYNQYRDISVRALKQYEELYPELTLTVDNKIPTAFRIKKFVDNEYYSDWHSEHCVDFPHRTLSVLIYLSDHNCGTEFFNGEVIISKKGRAVLFPASWTHTHRGQPCPEGKTRYIMSSYIELEKK